MLGLGGTRQLCNAGGSSHGLVPFTQLPLRDLDLSSHRTLLAFLDVTVTELLRLSVWRKDRLGNRFLDRRIDVSFVVAVLFYSGRIFCAASRLGPFALPPRPALGEAPTRPAHEEQAQGRQDPHA